VLLVDDDVRNIFSLTSALEQKGLKVEVGRNGFEAIARLDEVADIDLVLMDIMMPGMDGLEAMRRIRADGRFAKLPIIAITAKAMKDDQEQCCRPARRIIWPSRLIWTGCTRCCGSGCRTWNGSDARRQRH